MALARSALPCAILSLVVACDRDSAPAGGAPEPLVENAMRSALRARLHTAATSAYQAAQGLTLTDDTPRPDLGERPEVDEMTVFLPGASFRLPRSGLTGLALASVGRQGTQLLLRYGETSIEIEDRTGTAAARAEHERLLRAAPELDGEPVPEPERAEIDLAAWEAQFEKRYRDRPSRLFRAALRAQPPADDPASRLRDVYTRVRLLWVKRELYLSAGGGPRLAARALAAGPVVGLLKGDAERDPELHALLDGPDGMRIHVRVSQPGGHPAWRAVLASFRPYAPSTAAAAQLARVAEEWSARRALEAVAAALAAYHLDPRRSRAEALLRAVIRLPSQAGSAPPQTLAAQLAEALDLPAAASAEMMATAQAAD